MNSRNSLAILLAVLWYFIHYSYQLIPPEIQGAWFNIARSLGGVFLSGIVMLLVQDRLVFIAGTGLMIEDIQVVGCGVWWLIDPWPVTGELCSEKTGLPLTVIGLATLLVVLAYIRDTRDGHRSEHR